MTKTRKAALKKVQSKKSWRGARIFLWTALIAAVTLLLVLPSISVAIAGGLRQGIVIKVDSLEGYTVVSDKEILLVTHNCQGGRYGDSCVSSDYNLGDSMWYVKRMSLHGDISAITIRTLLNLYGWGIFCVILLGGLIKFGFKDS